MDLADFIPDVDTEKNVDLLPVAFNAFVANRVNKNGDVINTATALNIYKNFINKPINLEHNRDRVVGVILVAGFSEFGTDIPLTEEQVKDMKSPFNVTLGGVIWKVVNNSLVDLIEDSADPTSEFYKKISASWELGFKDYQLAILPEGEKNIEGAEFVTDASTIVELEQNLRAFGGSGRLPDGRYVYRQVITDVVPLGIGLTETPAADVSGILAENKKDKINLNENNSSQINQNTVKNNKAMKIENLNDINDETMKELSASSIADFIQSELEKASEQYKKDLTAGEEALKLATEKTEALEKGHVTLSEELSQVKSELEVIQKAQAEKEAEAKFNQRMSLLDDEYELSDEDRKILATDIKEMNDEVFSAFQEKIKVLLKEKSKAALAKKAEIAKANTVEVVASTKEAQNVVDDVLDNAVISHNEVPVSSEANQTLLDKYAAAFDYNQFEISTKR